MIDIKQLKHIVMLFETGTVTGAAERLHISQPALTTHLKRLESNLGEPLFVRSAKGLEPTPMGRSFYERAKVMLKDWLNFEHELRLLSGNEVGEIRVVCGAVFEQEILPDAIIEFLSLHPQVSLKVDVCNPERMLERLSAGEVDVAVGAFSDVSMLDVQQLPACKQQIGLYVRKGHALLKEKQLPVNFSGFLLASPQIPLGIGQWLNDQGAIGNQRHLASDSYKLLIQVALNSDLIIGGPEFLFTQYVNDGRFFKLPIDNTPNWEVSTLIARPASHSKIIRSFVNCLMAAMPDNS